jgi:membrane protein implicated in regulation of membrane protease activity
MQYLVALGVWNWFIAGAILLAIEIVLPGSFMLWLGLSALLVGVISMAVAWPWQAQFVVFALFALASIPAWRYFARRAEDPSDQPYLNRRADALVGRVFTLEKPIVDGVGNIRVDDTIWRTSGPSLPAGSRVRVVSADGANLAVDRAD